MISGLAARPWHSVEDHYPGLTPVVNELRAATKELIAEYGLLKERGLLLQENECISDATGGKWTTYSVNAAWVDRDPVTDCSFDTPAACGLLDRIKTTMATSGFPGGFQVLRMGYSALEAKAHLQPHCGMTNGQLKMHLGLIIPTMTKDGDKKPCAGAFFFRRKARAVRLNSTHLTGCLQRCE